MAIRPTQKAHVRAVRAVRAAQRELQDGIDEAQLQNVISGGRHQPATAGRTASTVGVAASDSSTTGTAAAALRCCRE